MKKISIERLRRKGASEQEIRMASDYNLARRGKGPLANQLMMYQDDLDQKRWKEYDIERESAVLERMKLYGCSSCELKRQEELVRKLNNAQT